MINLLPPENKIEIKKEYLGRLAVVSGSFFFISVLIAVMLLLPSLILMKSMKNNYERQLSFSEQRLALSGLNNAVSEAKELNSKLEIFESRQKKIRKISGIIENIIASKTRGVKIKGFFYDNEEISIQGFSRTRNDLLGLIDAFEKQEEFLTVESPASNLLKEKDIDFSIFIKLNGHNNEE